MSFRNVFIFLRPAFHASILKVITRVEERRTGRYDRKCCGSDRKAWLKARYIFKLGRAQEATTLNSNG